MNTSYEPQYIPAQGHQERIILFQHMKPKLKRAREQKVFKLKLLLEKSCIVQSNQENKYLLIIRLVRVKDHLSANTARHYCQVKDRQETCSRLTTRIHIMN